MSETRIDPRQPRAFKLNPSEPQPGSPVLVETADPFDPALAEAEDVPAASRWRFGLLGVFSIALSAFVSLAIGLWGVRLVEEMAAANPVLGWIAAGLGIVALLALLLMALREWLIMRRLASVETLRNAARKAHAEDDREAARAVAISLVSILDARSTDAGLELADHAKAIIDGSDLLKIAERLMLGCHRNQPARLGGCAVCPRPVRPPDQEHSCHLWRKAWRIWRSAAVPPRAVASGADRRRCHD
jgi:putative membrane protein